MTPPAGGGGDLLLVAHRWEAAHLPEDAPVVLTGVGMVPAAVATTRAILTHRPRRVVNLGSVGALAPGLGGIQRPSVVLNRDVDRPAMLSLGFDPDDRIELDGDGPVLGTGDSVVAGGPRRDELLGRCDLVDMEGYAVAWVCRELDTELVMIKHVSDQAEEDAHDWSRLVDASARALAAAYAEIAPKRP